MVKVTILDKDTNLKPEMSAKVTFVEPAVAPATATTQRLIVVPQTAVVTREGASQVFAIVDGVAQAKAVILGPPRSDGVVIRDGLAGTETLVARPPDSLRAGDRVRVRGA
jgi:hypothetical protein